jgi:hypothetical protein
MNQRGYRKPGGSLLENACDPVTYPVIRIPDPDPLLARLEKYHGHKE